MEVYADNSSSFAQKSLGSAHFDSTSGGHTLASNQPQPAAAVAAELIFPHNTCNQTAISCEYPHMWYRRTYGTPVIIGLSPLQTMTRSTGRRAWGEPNTRLLIPFNMPRFIMLTGGRNLARMRRWPWENADDSGPIDISTGDQNGFYQAGGAWSKEVQTRVVIAPASRPARTNVYLVLASASEVADGQDSANGVIPLPPEWADDSGPTDQYGMMKWSPCPSFWRICASSGGHNKRM